MGHRALLVNDGLPGNTPEGAEGPWGQVSFSVKFRVSIDLCLIANSSKLRLKVASCSAMTSACTACTCSPNALYWSCEPRVRPHRQMRQCANNVGL